MPDKLKPKVRKAHISPLTIPLSLSFNISIASPSVETSRIEVASNVEKKVIPNSNRSIPFLESMAAINIVKLIERIDKIIQDLLLPMFDSE